jgi:YbbR domain-containing protein
MGLFRQLGLKLLSFAMAVLLWLLVAGQKEAERSLRVPLEFQNIPPSLEMIGEPTGFVDVRLKGPSAALAQLRAGELVLNLDLSTARPGRRMFHLLSDHVSTPVGVRALNVAPSIVTLTFEASATKTVPVLPALDGEPAPGYVVGRVTASPASIEVVGPESIVRQLTQATTEPVNVGGAMGRVRDTVTIGVPDSTVRLKSPGNAVVVVEIKAAPIARTVRAVAVIPELAPGRVPAFVDLTGLRRGRYNLPVRIDATGDFSITGIDPPSVKVTIR